MTLITYEFPFLRNFVQQHSGNVISESQDYLLERQLKPVLKQFGFLNFAELVHELRTTPTKELRDIVVETMTINETSFFRDKHPFEALAKQILPALFESRKASKQLLLWSAACAAGQEAYSMAITALEAIPNSDWNVSIFATDLSKEMVERTKSGRYSKFEISRGLNQEQRSKYFEQRSSNDFTAIELLRNMIRPVRTNLIEAQSFAPKSDVIFLRNVLIYFDDQEKERILRRIRGALAADGILILGGGEALINLDVPFTRCEIGKAICFRPA